MGYIYTDQDGSLRLVAVPDDYVPITSYVTTGYTPPPQPGATFSCSLEQAQNLLTTTVCAGHEAAGPQPVDASDEGALSEKTLYDALVQINTGLVAETRGRELQAAMAALHRQHTFNGRPARYLPEA